MAAISVADQLVQRSLLLNARLGDEGVNAVEAFQLVGSFVDEVAAAGRYSIDIDARRALQVLLEGWVVVLRTLGGITQLDVRAPILALPGSDDSSLFRPHSQAERPDVRSISRAQFEDFLEGEDLTLEDAEVRGVSMPDADFRQRRVVNCKFVECDFHGAQFDPRSYFPMTSFIDCSLDEAQGGDRSGGLLAFDARFERVTLRNADMDLAIFNHAAFVNVELDPGASFRGCQFIDTSFRNFRSNGALLAESLFDAAKHEAGHSHMDMGGSDLSYASFRGSELKNVNFVGAMLRHCRFVGASLGGAKFESADVSGADFSGAKYLRRTDLHRSMKLSEAHFDSEDKRFFSNKVIAAANSGAPLETPADERT